jgi:DNA invertase Pin-like site-specific DNA recombinase
MSSRSHSNIVPVMPFVGSGPGMPVVLYLRKSNKSRNKGRDESVSIEQQRADLRAYCEKRGWIIVGEYIDDGKSASKNDIKRVEFARLLVDVRNADFRAVVVWDLSRLTRKDSVDAATAAAIFKNSGILVESLRDNQIDLNTEMGRHMWNLHCEGNNAFAKKVSGGTIRGRKDSLERGNFPGSQIPYGYRRQYWEGETLVKDLHREEPAGKARHWTTRLAIDPTEGPIATRIFRDFTSRDISIRGLAIELQREGVPTFSGKDWTPAHIKTILRCPMYRGAHAIGYSDQWERKAYETHERFEAQVKEDACPALIDSET